MKKIIFVFITIIAIAAPASIVSRNNSIKPTLIRSLQLPLTTKTAAEGQNLVVFTNVDSICDNGMDVVTLWVYKPKIGLPTIQLPCNAGIYGMSSEEDLPVGQSYVYYKKGGRYNVISVFDWYGNCLKHISLKNIQQKNR